MPQCQYCGKEIYLPFKCKYCGGTFCSEHRLPENHKCPEFKKGGAPKRFMHKEQPPEDVETEEAYEIQVKPQISLKPWRPQIEVPGKPRYVFTKTEIIHLTIGTLLVILVGLSYFFRTPSILIRNPFLTFAFTLIFILIFLPHELAHKFTAQRYGLWAEFQLIEWGAILTLISIFSPFKLIAPGAVVISGDHDYETIGKVALAGPITNLAIAIALLTTYLLFPITGVFRLFLVVGFELNVILGIFNMLPIAPLDGSKIIRWKTRIWGLVFSLFIGFLIIDLLFLTF